MNSAIAFIEKQSKETFLLYRDSKNKVIINDIDNGIMFDPAFSTYFEENNKEYLVGMIEVNRLKTHPDAFMKSRGLTALIPLGEPCNAKISR